MSEDLVTRPAELVNPATGQALALNESTDLLAAERFDVIETKRALDSYASYIDEELTARLDSENTRSATVGEWKIETKAPAVTKYPADRLGEVLDDLIAKGKLVEAVRDRVLVPQPPKPDLREINKLLSHGDQEVRQAVLAVGVEEPQRRTVSVKHA